MRIYPVFIFAIFLSILLKSFFFNPDQMESYSKWINLFWKWQINDIPSGEIIKTLILIGPSFDKDLFDPVIGTLRTEMGMSLLLPFLIIIALRLRLIINVLLCFVFFGIAKDVFLMFYVGIIIAKYHITIITYMNQMSTILVFIIFISSVAFYTCDFFLGYILPQRVIDFFEILGAAMFIVLALKNGIFKNILNTKVIHFFGKISYSLYLFHFPILLITLSLLPDTQYLVVPVSFTCTVIISYLSYEYIELYFMKLGKRVRFQKMDGICDRYFFKFFNYLNLK